MAREIRTAVLALMVVAVGLTIASINADVKASAVTGKYLLAFNICDAGACIDPPFKAYLAQSDDGVTWRPIPGLIPFKSDCPDPIRRGDTLYVFGPIMEGGQGPAASVCKYSFEQDCWSPPERIAVMGARFPSIPYGRELFIEPSTILDEQGRIVIFYRLFWRTGGRDKRDGDIEYIRSATEVEGSDGTEFRVDEGDRFTVEIHPGTSELITTVGNPDVFRGPDGYYILLGIKDGTMLLFSEELRGAYSLVEELHQGLIMTSHIGGQSAGHYDALTGQYWVYGVPGQGGNISPGIGFGSVARAVVSRLDQPIPTSKFQTVIDPPTVPGLVTVGASEPGFTVNEPWPETLGEIPPKLNEGGRVGCREWLAPALSVTFSETVPPGSSIGTARSFRYNVIVGGQSTHPSALSVSGSGAHIPRGDWTILPSARIAPFEAVLDVHHSLFTEPGRPPVMLEASDGITVSRLASVEPPKRSSAPTCPIKVEVVFKETVPPDTEYPEYFRYLVEVKGDLDEPIFLRVLAGGKEITEGVDLSMSSAVPPFEALLDVHYSLFDPGSPQLLLEASVGSDVCVVPIEFPW